MSLINQVLQDLDRRHAIAGAGAVPLATARIATTDADAFRLSLSRGSLGLVLLALVAATAAALIWRQGDGQAPAAVPVVAMSPSHAPAARAQDERAAAAIAVVAPPIAPIAPGDVSVAAIVDFKNDRPAVASSHDAATAELSPRHELSPGVSEPRAVASAAALVAPTSAPMRLEKSTPPPSPAERAEAEYRRGIELHERLRGGDAEAAFAAALQQDGRHAAARQALAVEWIGHGRTDDAERLLREGLAQNAHQPALAIVLARVQTDRHDLRGGIDTLRAALGAGGAASAEQAEARALLATLLQGAGQHREAIDAFGAALRQAPQNGPWWVGMGLSLAAEGRAEGASEAFDRARATGNLSPELLAYVEQRLRATSR